MEFIMELHAHSKYAAACSDQLTLENMAPACERKGLQIIGTGDFTHPLWLKDIKEKLEEERDGVFKLRNSQSKTRFLLTSEVSIVFSKNKSLVGKLGVFDRTGNVKRFHNGIIAPSIEVVEQINDALGKFGNLASDGRPMLTVSASELVEIVHGISKDALIFAAHAWTPWFGIFGSLSGFDSVEDAYEDQAMHVSALETGLSADPAMFWRISRLDKYTIISGSDAHSLPKLGREATAIELDKETLSFKTVTDAIRNKKIKYTVEFYPEEGKYHYDGHRKCNVALNPEESARYNNKCPVCGKPLTLGVLHRVNELADREPGYVPKNAMQFVHAIPLQEIIAFVGKKTVASTYVKTSYERLIGKFGTEFNLLLKADIADIEKVDKELARAIDNIRRDRVNMKPGYDGVFGTIDVLNVADSQKQVVGSGHGQKTMGDF